MRKTIEVEESLPEVDITRNDRTQIADDLKQYWLGRTSSNIGLQYFKFDNGLVRSRGELAYLFERADIFVLQYRSQSSVHLGVNVFVHMDGRTEIQPWRNCELDTAETEKIKEDVKAVMLREKAYIQRHVEWFRVLPDIIEECDGKTVQEAIDILTKYGFGLTTKETI